MCLFRGWDELVHNEYVVVRNEGEDGKDEPNESQT